MALYHYCIFFLIKFILSPLSSLSFTQSLILSLSLAIAEASHQASLFLSECLYRFILTHLQISLPIYSSHKPNTLDSSTHLTLHSIILSSNQDSQGFWVWVWYKILFAKSQNEAPSVLGVLCPLGD